MPKRIIDFEAMWGSGKLNKCRPENRVEYSWLYGLADVNGSFELTNMAVIFGKVSPIRPELTIDRLEQIFDDFHRNDLLYKWKDDATGKIFGHWIGSEKDGRLPPRSQRERYSTSAPPVPKEKSKKALAPLSISGSTPDQVKIKSTSTSGQEGLGLGLDLARLGESNTTSTNAQKPRVVGPSLVSALAQTKTLTPQQKQYGLVNSLANEAMRMICAQIEKIGRIDHFSLKEDLKLWCAQTNTAYDGELIERAITIGEQRLKTA